jgi:hypothetical protein
MNSQLVCIYSCSLTETVVNISAVGHRRGRYDRYVMPTLSGNLLMKTVRISETSVYFNETTRRCIPEGSHLYKAPHE